jgi:hypothetical protein
MATSLYINPSSAPQGSLRLRLGLQDEEGLSWERGKGGEKLGYIIFDLNSESRDCNGVGGAVT